MLTKCCDGIVYMAKRYGEEIDVRQTVDMTFFNAFLGIKDEIRKRDLYHLVGFLYSYFFYLLKRT